MDTAGWCLPVAGVSHGSRQLTLHFLLRSQVGRETRAPSSQEPQVPPQTLPEVKYSLSSLQEALSPVPPRPPRLCLRTYHNHSPKSTTSAARPNIPRLLGGTARASVSSGTAGAWTPAPHSCTQCPLTSGAQLLVRVGCPARPGSPQLGRHLRLHLRTPPTRTSISVTRFAK